LAIEGLIEARDPGLLPAASARGRIDRLLGLPERLPLAAPVWWLVLFGAMVAIPSAVLWLVDAQPVGTIDARIWVAALLAAYAVGFKNVLDAIAARAFRAFEPALPPEVDRAAVLAALVSVPDRVGLAAIAVVEIAITIGYFSDPGEFRHFSSRPPIEQAMILIPNWISIALAAVLLAYVLRQLRMVSRLHAIAVVDLFDAVPTHAFARLTSASAIGILVFGLVVVTDPSAGRDTPVFFIEAAAILALAVVVFGLPLRGMHDRLTAEKAVLLRSVNGRIKVTLARVHDSVDAAELDRSAALHESLSSLVAERDLIERLSTWPWSPATFRGFAGALVLPVVVWAIIRVLERFV
jgi:hypothetical protein